MIYNLQSCYKTSRPNKKNEILDIIKASILLHFFVKIHLIANSCKSVTSIASFFCLCVDIKVEVLFSFKMNSKQFYSFDDFISLLWDYYSFGFWLLLALKLTIRIIRSNMLEGVGKTLQNQQCGHYVKWYKSYLLLRFKMLCCVLFYIEFSSNIFEFICDSLHELAR